MLFNILEVLPGFLFVSLISFVVVQSRFLELSQMRLVFCFVGDCGSLEASPSQKGTPKSLMPEQQTFSRTKQDDYRAFIVIMQRHQAPITQ